MPKIVYCSECGLGSTIIRKAMPKFGRIIDLIEPHTCLKEPIQPDLTVNPVPMYVQEAKGKFVQILNDLQPTSLDPIGVLGSVSTDDLADRRGVDVVKSTAPKSILTGIGSLNNTPPAHDLTEPNIPSNDRSTYEEDE